MKESLAARQAALLRQNAELDQKVEAIEQRRQQQLQTAKSASSSAAKLHELTPAEPALGAFSDGDNGSLNGDMSDGMSSPERATSPASRRGLAMDLSASIESAPSEKKENQRVMIRSKSLLKRDKSLGNVNATAPGAAPGSSDSARKPLRRHKTGLPKEASGAQQHHKESTPSPDAKRAATADAADGEDGMGLEATVRYQKARLRVLQDELEVAQSDAKSMHGTEQQLKATIEELAEENASLRKKQQQTQLLLEKQQELSAAQESKQKILETQLSAAQAKMDELQKAEKQASQQFRSKDVRLNRALEELEKVKAQLQEERRSQGEQTVTKAEHEQVLKENKRLEKQKNELLSAFKKQMKLIDLLKRQRIHMEAAKMLSFTEEEFSKTLELG